MPTCPKRQHPDDRESQSNVGYNVVVAAKAAVVLKASVAAKAVVVAVVAAKVAGCVVASRTHVQVLGPSATPSRARSIPRNARFEPPAAVAPASAPTQGSALQDRSIAIHET